MILSILDLCLLPYFSLVSSNHFAGAGLGVGRMQAENQEVSPFQAGDQVLYNKTRTRQTQNLIHVHISCILFRGLMLWPLHKMIYLKVKGDFESKAEVWRL